MQKYSCHLHKILKLLVCLMTPFMNIVLLHYAFNSGQLFSQIFSAHQLVM